MLFRSSENEHLLILYNRQRKVFNAWFSVGCILFVCSMFFKAMHDEKIAALPLAISTFILLTGVWKLSGAGKIYFDKSAGKIYRFYKHLGYVQKLYTNPIQSVEYIEVNGNSLSIRMDNSDLILITSEKNTTTEINQLAKKISEYLSVKVISH